jgi:diguanylate cyclase (GGDEF)-like protein/PAS domain S-box-containing protein
MRRESLLSFGVYERLKERYADLLADSATLLWALDRDLRWIDLNESGAHAIYGYPAAEMFGRPFVEFSSPEHVRADLLALNSLAVKSRERTSFTTIHRRADDTPVALRFVAEPFAAGEATPIYVGIASEIARRPDATVGLLDDQTLFRATIAASPGIFYLSDAEGKVLLWNENVELVTGYSPEELSAMNVLQFIKPEDLGHVMERIEQAFRTGSATAEAHFLAKDGTPTPYLFTGKLVQFAGTPCLIGMGIDITEQRASEARLHHLAHHDPLTGLPNRTRILQAVAQAIDGAACARQKAAILFIDLDRFKVINDSLGHSLGDELLRMLAQRMEQCIRPGDMLARLGGDEFVVLLPHVADATRASEIAEAILDMVTSPFSLEGRELNVTASVGIAIYPDDGEEVGELLRNADSAMYHAKSSGRGCYAFFAPAMNVAVRQRLELDNDLRAALRRNEFFLHYQPFVDATSNRIVAFEALLRWEHPRLGLLPPGRFLDYAEESGIIVPLGNWALREACRTLRAWHDLGHADLNVAVNVSAMQVLGGRFVEVVRTALEEFRLEPRHLELELTESLFLQSTDEVLSPLRQLDRLGISLVIDDFGIGYSSLSYLKNFPIRKLKIDRSFVAGVAENRNDAAIVVAIAGWLTASTSS